MIRNWIDDLLLSLSFLTRLRIRVQTERQLDAASRAFSLAGFFIGLPGAAILAFNAYFDGTPVVGALLAVMITIMITGALHEDGLADCADGLWQADDREKALAIMRDSRIGVFGTLALIFSVLWRVVLLAVIPDAWAVWLAAQSIGRTGLPAILRLVPAARSDGLAAGFGTPPAESTGWALTIGIALVLILMGVFHGIVALFLAGIVAAIIVRHAERRIGGITGDVLGAVEQAVEGAVLLAALLFHFT